MPQPTLHTERLTLIPLADEHLEWEVELDSDPEVMRFLSGRASTRAEVEAGHERRMAAARKVDGLGFWVGLLDGAFVGWWTLQPAHGPDQPDDPGVADLDHRSDDDGQRCVAGRDSSLGPVRASTTGAAEVCAPSTSS